jgi:hypothetical protein
MFFKLNTSACKQFRGSDLIFSDIFVFSNKLQPVNKDCALCSWLKNSLTYVAYMTFSIRYFYYSPVSSVLFRVSR